MSRCFPFPPPGCEKKPSTDELDLLKKEKRKEKKHKKDKKDGKEKKEKDRSEGKHKDKKDKNDKKDKKDKHRDKKKEKEKEKEKENNKEKGKSSAPDEKKGHGQLKGYNEEKPHYTNEQNKEKSSFSSDRQPFLQFQSGQHNGQLQKKEESRKEKNSPSDGKKSSILFRGENGELVQNRIKASDTENVRFVQELDRRIRNEEKGTGSHQFFVEGRKHNFDNVEAQKTDGRQAIMDVARFGRNAAIQNKINGTTTPPLDNRIDRRFDQKERMQEKESDDKRGHKRKHKDRDKQRQGKDKDSEKEKKRKKEKSKEKREKKSKRNKDEHSNKNDSIATIDSLLAHPLEYSFQGAANEGNLKKRKDMVINGASDENESRPNKMARHISPENGRKLDSLQNTGSSFLDKQRASQGESQNSFNVGSKGQMVNGMIASPPLSLSAKKLPTPPFNHLPSKPSPIKSPPVITNHVAPRSLPTHPPLVPATKLQPNHLATRQVQVAPKPPVPSTTAKQPAPLPKPPTAVNKVAPQPSLPTPQKKPKPPHPDTKYLSQILTVPKPEPWCGFDDQEWLSSSSSSKAAGPSTKKSTMEEVQVQVQVWSEAKRIESADVCALPYVIPY